MAISDPVIEELLMSKFGIQSSELDSVMILLSVFDTKRRDRWIHEKRDMSKFKPLYEPFTIISGAVFYDRIRYGTIRVDNDKNFISFLHDDESASLSASSGRVDPMYRDALDPTKRGFVAKYVVLSFNAVDSFSASVLIPATIPDAMS